MPLDFIFLEAPKKDDSNELITKAPQLGQKHFENNSCRIQKIRDVLLSGTIRLFQALCVLPHYSVLGDIIEGKFISIGKILRSRCTWVGIEQQLLPLHKQKKKELQTTGAGKELHFCTSLRPDGDKRQHLVRKSVPSWPGKQREGTWFLCPSALRKGIPSHQMAWKKQISAGSQTNQVMDQLPGKVGNPGLLLPDEAQDTKSTLRKRLESQELERRGSHSPYF